LGTGASVAAASDDHGQDQQVAGAAATEQPAPPAG
jgi:hypothetical protein